MRRTQTFLRTLALGAALIAFGAIAVSAVQAEAAPRKRSAETSARQHRVAEGETVYGISRTYGVSPQVLIETNRLRAPYHLNAGQRLVVPGAAPGGRQPAASGSDGPSATMKRPSQRASATVTERNPAPPAAASGDLRPREAAVSRSALRSANGPVQGRVKPGQSPQERAAAIGPIAGDVSATGSRAPGADLGGRAGPSRRAKARKGQRVDMAEPAARPAAKGTDKSAGMAAVRDNQAAGAPQKVPPRSSSRFAWPVKGDVTQSFGRQAGGVRNDGITIRAKPGSDIRAAENGLVIFAGQGARTSGQVVLLKHADDWITTYSPMADIKVRRGQVVKKGDPLGRVAAVGSTRQGQLQFQARHDGVPVDPIDRLSSRSQVATR